MIKRAMALMLALALLWTIPAMAEGDGLAGILSFVFSQVQQPGAVGRWRVVDFIGDDGMRATIREVDEGGGLMVLLLTENSMSLHFVLPEEMSGQTTAITMEEDAIISNGKRMSFVLEGNTMRLEQPTGVMVLERLPADSPLGAWEMTGLSGPEGADAMWLTIRETNSSSHLVITDQFFSVILQSNGEYRVETESCRMEGNVIHCVAERLTYTVEGDSMTIVNSNGVTMTYRRLH